MFDVIEDGFTQVFYAAKTIAADSLLGDFGEEPLHLVKPTTVGRDEVQLPARMLGDPQTHLRRLVRSVIVQNSMNV